MWIGRPGPVQLDIPAAIVYEEGDDAGAPIWKPAQYRAPPPQPSLAQIRQAAALLIDAKHPIIFSGSGVDRAGATGALLELVELLNCPIIRSWSGRSTIPADHPNYVEASGFGGDAVKQEADVILVAGSRLGNLDLPYDKYWGDPATQKLIQIDIDPRNIGVSRPITLGIVADLKPSLENLVGELKAAQARSAIGAKLADPSREVVCSTGDGAAGFNFMEMQTAARENLRITVVVFAEGAWTMEEPNQLHRYGRTFGTQMGTVRWDKVAEGLGCHGQYVERIDELEPALTRARENEGPSVVCVKTDHAANLNIHPDFIKRFMEVYAGPIG